MRQWYVRVYLYQATCAALANLWKLDKGGAELLLVSRVEA